MFVELEHPSENTFLKATQDFGGPYRKGINQVNDWRRYLEKHFNKLAPVFRKFIKQNDSLPSEFLENDSTRRHYVVVTGRRSHYEINKEKTYEIRRNEEKTAISNYYIMIICILRWL
ncbi:Shedu anti-phage system protein SduA domain-containing protein [Caldifermentibacillus hisashii]|uniref:Shedu anti-phage system protein SduA domain-containing protein n=1 Tax=Caldifermentibacillus hisashii TaxID=996558 RepID=UPI003CC76C93